MNRNPSPKAELLKNDHQVKRHHAILETTVDLYLHLDIALKEMQRRAAQVDPTNFNLCASAHLRMLGAQEFVDTFLNLAETPDIPKRADNTNLASNLRKQ